MKFYLAGQWQDRDEKINVTNPDNGEVIDTVPSASADDVEIAIHSASQAKPDMARLTGYERFQILRRASDLVLSRKQELAETISREDFAVLICRAAAREEQLSVASALGPCMGSKEMNENDEIGV